jgi:hypothetical protein
MLRKRTQYRILTAAFLFSLVGVAFFSGYMGLRYQDASLIRETAKQQPSGTRADQQYQESWWVRATTDPLAMVTLLLAIATFWMGWGVRRQVGLARDEFIASHRPRLIVTFVKRFLEQPEIHPSEQAVAVDFMLRNSGTSDAWVVSSNIAIRRFRPGIWPHPDELDGIDEILETTASRRRIPVSKSLRVRVRTEPIGGIEDVFGISDDEPSPTEFGQWAEDRGYVMSDRLYLIGWIQYEDAAGSLLTTYFCREYSRETGCFAPARDCD